MNQERFQPIRVLLADDSLLALRMLQRILEVDPRIEVVATARNGEEALKQVLALRPDVICTDLHMPVMDGLELTRRVMDQQPTPIIVISVSVSSDKQENIFSLLQAGATEIIVKPEGVVNLDSAMAQQLCFKVVQISNVRVFRHPYNGADSQHRAGRRQQIWRDVESQSVISPEALSVVDHSCRVVAIGASTGGPTVLLSILAALPKDFPLPLLCVQHISRGFSLSLVQWLDERSALKVRLAHEGERITAGVVYFPPDDCDLLVDGDRLVLLRDRSSDGSTPHPSVDQLFETVAESFGSGAIAVLLTGMGEDGARGMVRVVQAGGYAVVQDEESSVVYGMPRAAQYLMTPNKILGGAEIGSYLHHYVGRCSQAGQGNGANR